MPNYCKEILGSGKNQTVVGIPMVSFCDIPIMRVHDFSSRYGKFAISFTKEWALKNHINPILYIENEDIDKAMQYFWNLEYEYSKLAKFDLKELNDKGNYDDYMNFFNSIFSHQANNAFFGFSKRYEIEREGKIQINYIENEWRYVVKESEDYGINWLFGEKAYKDWRGEGKTKPVTSKELKEQKLIFSVDDITNLITSSETDTIALIKDIRLLKSFCGGKLSEFDKDKLINKIISFEKIENDF